MYSVPAKLNSDRGSQFTSKVWEQLGNLMGIKLARTSGFNPRSNGLSEARNKSIVHLLRCLASHKPNQWDDYLPAVTMALNSTIHTAHGHTPYNIIYGRDPITPIDQERLMSNDDQPMAQILEDMLTQQKLAQEMSMAMHAKRDRQLKEIHDSKIKDSKIISGDIVFYYRPSLNDPHANKKLQNPYSGPYIVVERHLQGTVTLKHLHTGKFVKHRVSITQLKRPTHYRLLPEETENQDSAQTKQSKSIQNIFSNKEDDGQFLLPMFAPKAPYMAIPNVI